VNNRIPASRWRSAQRLELQFWTRWTTLAPYRNLDIPKYWHAELARFGETWECFRGLRVLDVGCGPFGLIHYADSAAERIRIDPLLPQYSPKQPLAGRHLSIAAMAESLPLADRSVDFAICFNALDHMLNPAAALDEMARVLRPGGTALLMIHTFPGWLIQMLDHKWLRPLLALDRMHPHHFTSASFESMVRRRFRIDRSETVRRRFEAPHWWKPSQWKYTAGNLLVSGIYLRATQI
jgi:ubiquinone/menaquinone biosynthesis C-methylase UbiE